LKKLKKFDLLQIKEKLKMQQSICDLNGLEADTEKCNKINNELQILLEEYNSNVDKIGVNSFKSNRHLMHKMLDQKEVMLNRLEFLENEKSVILEEVTKSQVKREIFIKKRAEVKKQLKNERINKKDNSLMIRSSHR
tara:strand:- start:520 stop:930 length:411 start_codon:yes stop_codon:yes gene_type:complete